MGRPAGVGRATLREKEGLHMWLISGSSCEEVEKSG